MVGNKGDTVPKTAQNARRPLVPARPSQPAGAGHFVAVFEDGVALVTDHAAEIPQQGPEGGGLVHGPLPEANYLVLPKVAQ